MARAVDLVIQRIKPREGWLPLLLLAAIVGCVITAVLEVAWVPDDGVVIPAALGGFLLGTILAKRPLSPISAWILITLYGVAIPLIGTAQLWPTWSAWLGGWASLRPYWLQNGALFLDRMGSWGTAVFSNQSSQETIAFTLGLALLSYFLTAFASWQLFRQHRPLPGLLALGLGLAFNGYFGGGQIWWLATFVGLTALLTAMMHHFALTEAWDKHQVDYSGELRMDLLLHASAIAAILLVLALTLPSFSIRRLVQRFQAQPVVQQTEAALERAFGGVENRAGGQPSGPDGVGGSGILPRSFLLDAPPELAETVVMTAVVQSEANLTGLHWRALSYDVYTGRGWALSEERTEPLDADTAIALPAVEAAATVSQTVHWVLDKRLTRYTLGLPQQLEQEATVFWRGQTDLVRINSANTVYTAVSQVSQATPTMLRGTAVADVPPALLARYTRLPDSIPQRVLDLATEIADNQSNPYDQAHAIEQFLRQYPYSLEVQTPPREVDPVDHFLFEQRAGYCDFYASAMVVLARAVGLPARLAVGYLAQPTDENGVQTVYQINGHSWAEVYFAEYGWVEFEPTPAFVSPHAFSEPSPTFGTQMPDFAESQPLEIPPIPPEESEERPFPWALVLAAAGLFGLVYAWWRRGQLPAGADAVIWSYGRLEDTAVKLGQGPQPSQTPQEFLAMLQTALSHFGQSPRLARQIERLRPHLTQLTNLYMQRRYAGDAESGRIKAWQSWQQVKRPLFLLRIVRMFANWKQ
ncbi:MAG: transglutaminase domain-containing protein [Ardenticatenaceae bacterium]|nr:transglutaminase domain-containing protein [Ardenticatenaceae bacterium]